MLCEGEGGGGTYIHVRHVESALSRCQQMFSSVIHLYKQKAMIAVCVTKVRGGQRKRKERLRRARGVYIVLE